MFISRIQLKNWRNFRDLDVSMGARVYIIGANASGKSNFLDVFRFLRDVCKPSGGGLQKAVYDRGGIKKLRCIHARKDTEVLIECYVAESLDSHRAWQYTLGFKSEGSGYKRIQITKEKVVHPDGHTLLDRPDDKDKEDKERLVQTALEQINANHEFRVLSEFFRDTVYLHLVPQLLKFKEINAKTLEDDPFGQGLLQRIAKTPQKTRDARLRKIQEALKIAVPHFSELMFIKDESTGRPHLQACYQHWRPHGAWQTEEQFSDGTLRLIGLLWILQEKSESMPILLLEEPELSLNDAIVEMIPIMIDRVLRKQKNSLRQVMITTHSESLLKNPLDPDAIVVLEMEPNGTTARKPDEKESKLMRQGLTAAEVVLSKTRPQHIEQLSLW
jgi:predicted ATPase